MGGFLYSGAGFAGAATVLVSFLVWKFHGVDAFTLNTLLSASGSTTVSTVFPGYGVAYQLRQVAQIIKLRGSTGMRKFRLMPLSFTYSGSPVS